MPVKLLYITSNLSLGGAERQLYYLIRGLDKSRFTAHVVPLWPDYTMRSQFEEAGATIVAIHKKCRYDATVLLRLRSFIRVLRPDIVHCQMYTANMWGRIAAVLAGAKTIIVSERNSDYLWKNRWHFAVERRLNRFARVFLGNSHRVCQYCEQNLRLPTGTFRLMYNGVDTNEFRPPSQRLGALSSGPLVGTVANLYPNKDLGTFVRMAVRVSERHPNARFRVIGYGTERDASHPLPTNSGLGTVSSSRARARTSQRSTTEWTSSCSVRATRASRMSSLRRWRAVYPSLRRMSAARAKPSTKAAPGLSYSREIPLRSLTASTAF
jgi:glycosyltransferase involved in cell wall biosynthesis